MISSLGGFAFGLAQLFFLYFIIKTIKGGEKATDIVWEGATGLEFEALPSPPPGIQTYSLSLRPTSANTPGASPRFWPGDQQMIFVRPNFETVGIHYCGKGHLDRHHGALTLFFSPSVSSCDHSVRPPRHVRASRVGSHIAPCSPPKGRGSA